MMYAASGIIVIAAFILLALMVSGPWKRNGSDSSKSRNEEMNAAQDKQVKDEEQVLRYYTAFFSTDETTNQTALENTGNILSERIEMFGMTGNVYISDDSIGMEVGIYDEEQENYLKYLGTPGKLEIRTTDGNVLLDNSMIENSRITTLIVGETETDALEIDIKAQYTDKFKTITENASGKDIYITLDDNILVMFTWDAVIESGKLILTCFDEERLNAVNVLLSTGTLPVRMYARYADSTE